LFVIYFQPLYFYRKFSIRINLLKSVSILIN